MCDMYTICVHSYYARSYLCHQTDLGLLISHISLFSLLSLPLSLYFLHAIRWSASLPSFYANLVSTKISAPHTFQILLSSASSKFRMYANERICSLFLSLSLYFFSGRRFISRDKETLVTVSLSLDRLPRFHCRAMRVPWAPFPGSADVDKQRREYPNRGTARVHGWCSLAWPSLIRRARCAAAPTRKVSERPVAKRASELCTLIFSWRLSTTREDRAFAREMFSSIRWSRRPPTRRSSRSVSRIREAGPSRRLDSIPAVF